MKHNIINIALVGCALVSVSSCSDFLETSSPSVTNASVVMSSYDNCRSAMDGAYTTFHNALSNQFHANGVFYALDAAGSDIERHGGERNVDRLAAETFYNGGNPETLLNYDSKAAFKDSPDDPYSRAFSIITTLNTLTDAVGEKQFASTKSEEYKQVYGEAICMKATCYRELIKTYGDVPFMNSLADKGDITSRLDIYPVIIKDLQDVLAKGYLKAVDKNGKHRFSKEYAYAMLGRIALEAGGYQTYRLDVTEASRLEKHPDYTDANGATFARPTNWKEYYEIAYNAFKALADDPGNVGFDENDYTTFFTQMHAADGGFADESIFEDIYTANIDSNERPYSSGRPSNGGSSNKFPCKGYGQNHINVAFYYGMFDPKDIRRDVACVVTGSTGEGYECLIPFDFQKQAKGAGISCGKYDENRQQNVNTLKQRLSGINDSYIRMSEVYLGLAECCVMLGKDDALKYFNKTYKRAMGVPYAGTLDLEKVIDERGFEFAGEGDRRFTLIRTGLIGKKIKAIKDLTKEMLAGVNAKGFYQFANGNEISAYIYTKMVDPKAVGLPSRLTPATPAAMRVAAYEPTTDAEAVQFPGWRGQHDWDLDCGNSSKKVTYYGGTDATNLAIKGLFKHIPDAEAPEGYTKVKWIQAIFDDSANNLESFYNDEIFNGWDYKSAPVYMIPFNFNNLIGGLTNGYGFGQSW